MLGNTIENGFAEKLVFEQRLEDDGGNHSFAGEGGEYSRHRGHQVLRTCGVGLALFLSGARICITLSSGSRSFPLRRRAVGWKL